MTASNEQHEDQSGQISQGFLALARAMSQDQPQGMGIESVLRFAAESLSDSEHAGITYLKNPGQLQTLAATGDIPGILDKLQFHTDQGPCLQALRNSDIVLAEDLSSDQQWPDFAAQAVKTTPVRSMLSYRLFLTEHDRGALNFYSSRPGAFNGTTIGLGAIFAAYASLTLLNWLHSDKIMHLERALETNREIGVATGILMAHDRCSREQAFTQLVQASQNLNRKVRDLEPS